MQILSIKNADYSYNYTTFGINLQSKKLQFKEDDFYVMIRGYGRNSEWARKIKETADKAVFFIRKKLDFETTLKNITQGVTEANQYPLDLEKRQHTGILRVAREGWKHGSNWKHSDSFLITGYGSNKNNKYKIYMDRFDYTIKKPLQNPYNDICLTRPIYDKDTFGKFLNHPHAKFIPSAFEHLKTIYNKLYTKYIINEPKKDNLNNINALIAEMRWILAHSTPWERGSDAISNTFIRSIYKAMGIKAYPLKKGVSLDLEAYCTNLDDYKKKFANYFIKKPEIID